MSIRSTPSTGCILGVDLGATSLRVASMDRFGADLLCVPTPPVSSAEAMTKATLRRAAHGRKVHSIGLSRAPGINRQGVVSDWPGRPEWTGLPLLSWLHQASGAHAVSADDGVCCTLWECHANAESARGGATACIGIGTGVAVGIMREDQLLPSGEGADTLSHQRFGTTDLPCKCGRRGCLQTILSVQGLEDIVNARRLDEVDRTLAEFVHRLKSVYQVDRIIVTGGGVDRFGPAFLRGIFERAADAEGISLIISRSPGLSGAGGALLLAARHVQEHEPWWASNLREPILEQCVPNRSSLQSQNQRGGYA